MHTAGIDGNGQTTHWLHPRLLLEQKREEYEHLQAEAESKAVHHRRRIKEFRDKLHVLETQLEGTVDRSEAEELQERVDAMNAVIKR